MKYADDNLPTVSVIGQLQTVDGLCGAEVRYGHMVEVKYDMHSSLVLSINKYLMASSVLLAWYKLCNEKWQ